MERRRLGNSELEVTPIGLGCWQFSQSRGLIGRYWEALPDERIREILEVTIDSGINWLDTAEAYGRGQSERAIRAGLRSLRVEPGRLVIATKWFPVLKTADNIARSFPDRQQALGEYRVDLYQIHQPLSLSSIRAQMREMAELVAEGRIRAIGVSNFNARQMREAYEALDTLGVPLASNQVRYSLLDRRIEEDGVLDTARELGVTIIAYSPLGQGILTGKYHADPRAIRQKAGPRKYMRAFGPQGLAQTEPLVGALAEIAEGHGVTPAQVALSWVISAHGSGVVAIPGATRAEQAAQNAGAIRLRLEEDEIDHLARLSGRPVALRV
jgi:aryl-alcohol dehydrogenase-like predicted oxidoreductase